MIYTLKKAKVIKYYVLGYNIGGVFHTYKYWYHIENNNEHILVDEFFAEAIWNIDDYYKKIRIKKFKKIIK